MTPREALELGIRELSLDVPLEGRAQLAGYIGLLAKWNKTHNLTAVRNPLAMMKLHVLDSLAIVARLPHGTRRLADVGSGGGLPGIPLAIARPHWHVVLNDSNGKKAAFLRQAAIELGLGNVSVHEGRVEAWAPEPRFDGVVSRAFASLAEFVRLCRHLVEPGGWLAAMKGARPDDEMAALPADVACEGAHSLHVPFVEAQRHLVLCRLRGG